MNPADKPDLFLSVIESNKGIIYKIVNSYCKQPEDRKDLVQEIMIQLWKSFEKYNDNYSHSTWIYRIALNVAISFYRKENTRQKIAQPLKESILDFADINGTQEKEANFNILQQFISGLKDLDKALMLLYLEEKSYKEIAAITGITETNVATKIARIKKSLRQNFDTINQQ